MDLTDEELRETRILNGVIAGDELYTKNQLESVKVLYEAENRKIVSFYEEKLKEMEEKFKVAERNYEKAISNTVPFHKIMEKIEYLTKLVKELEGDVELCNSLNTAILHLKELLESE